MTAQPAPTRRLVHTNEVPAIEVEGLTKGFGETLALDDVDLVVPPGGVVGCWAPTAPARPRSCACSRPCWPRDELKDRADGITVEVLLADPARAPMPAGSWLTPGSSHAA